MARAGAAGVPLRAQGVTAHHPSQPADRRRRARIPVGERHRLAELLGGALPAGCPAAFEFRHVSWFDDEVYTALRDRGACLCIAESGDDIDTPFVATGDWGYLRLRREDYDDAMLERWAARLRDASWSRAFVFFKHEDAGAGPRLAARFREIFGPDS